MLRRLLLCSFVLGVLTLPPPTLQARERVQGWCEQGGNTLTVVGLETTDKAQQSFPGCTVTVWDAGTTDIASIFSDDVGTIKANPFTADSTTGLWFFYADNARYDVQLSGAGIAAPFTLSDFSLDDSAQVVTTIAVVASSATPVFDVGKSSILTNILTADVTSSTITNGVTGQVITIYLAQDGTGGWTFVWPANVQLRGGGFVVSDDANAVSTIGLYFDGANWREIGIDSDEVGRSWTPAVVGGGLGTLAAQWDAFLRSVTLSGQGELGVASADPDFMVVLLPDTQNYSASLSGGTPAMFNAQTQWACDNAVGSNIKAVVSLGDIVNDGALDAEWTVADTAYDILDACSMPYAPTLGNHDYNPFCGAACTRTTTKYDANFPPSRIDGSSWFGGVKDAGTLANHYITFTNGTRTYIVIALEFYPRDAALTWAQGIIDANPTAVFIIVTHAYLNNDNTRVADDVDPGGPQDYGLTADNDGQEMWDEFVKLNQNIIVVVNGHMPGAFAARFTDVGNNGNTVHQMYSNYQFDTNGGNGFLRRLKFRPSLGVIEVTTFSPFTGGSKTDALNQFTLPYRSFLYDADISSAKNAYILGELNVHGDTLLGERMQFLGGSVTSITDNGDYVRFSLNDSTKNFALNAPGVGGIRLNFWHGSGGLILYDGNQGQVLSVPSSGDALLDGYSDTENPFWVGRRARNTAASPSAAQSADILFGVGGRGYDGTDFLPDVGVSPAIIFFVAAENFTDTTQGTRIQFHTTTSGGTSRSEVFRVRDDKDIGWFSGTGFQGVFAHANTAERTYTLPDFSGRVPITNQLDFTDGDTTPSVVGGSVFRVSNTSSTTITNFDDGATGQEIFINCLDSNTTITDGGSLLMAGDLVCTPQDTLTLVKLASGSWLEKARSVN